MQNFWEKSNWAEIDKHFSALEKAPFGRPFPFLPKGKGLFVICGPRQIGKSPWLKEVLKLGWTKNNFLKEFP